MNGRAEFPLPRGNVMQCDPRGAHVVMRHKGRELLGEVRRAYRDSAGYWRLDVRHFNGEAWPVAPSVGMVEVLERTYADGDA